VTRPAPDAPDQGRPRPSPSPRWPHPAAAA